MNRRSLIKKLAVLPAAGLAPAAAKANAVVSMPSLRITEDEYVVFTDKNHEIVVDTNWEDCVESIRKYLSKLFGCKIETEHRAKGRWLVFYPSKIGYNCCLLALEKKVYDQQSSRERRKLIGIRITANLNGFIDRVSELAPMVENFNEHLRHQKNVEVWPV